jgi:hypothetical protein
MRIGLFKYVEILSLFNLTNVDMTGMFAIVGVAGRVRPAL